MIGPELAKQNALRADAGLPPLPDPFSVRQRGPSPEDVDEGEDPG